MRSSFHGSFWRWQLYLESVSNIVSCPSHSDNPASTWAQVYVSQGTGVTASANVYKMDHSQGHSKLPPLYSRLYWKLLQILERTLPLATIDGSCQYPADISTQRAFSCQIRSVCIQVIHPEHSQQLLAGKKALFVLNKRFIL